MESEAKSKSKPKLTVRSFKGEDQQAVSRLYDEGLLEGQIDDGDTGADIENVHEAYLADPRHHLWVVEKNGEVVGMIGVGSDEPHTAEIRRLRVDHDHQETEIPCKLLETAIAHCKRHGYLKVRLDTRFEQDEAIDLFDRIGFQHTRTRSVKGKDLLEFYLDLYRQTDDEE